MGRLNGCCCCFNLRDGSQAVGITLLVLGSLGLVTQIGTTIWLTQQETYRSSPGVTAQLLLMFGFYILHLIMNALLVHGVNKSNRGMILAWLIYYGIITGLQSVGAAIVFIIFCVYGIWLAILITLAVAALIGVFWYWFVVVLHYYQDLRERNGFVYGKQPGEAHAL